MAQTLSNNACKNDKKDKKKFTAIHLLPEVYGRSVKHYINDLSRKYYVKKSEFAFDCLICDSTMNSWSEFLEHIKNPSHLQQKEEKMNFTAICVKCKYIFMTEDLNSVVRHFNCHQENPYRTKNISATTDETVANKHKNRNMNFFEVKDNGSPSLGSIKPKLPQSEVDEKHNESGHHVANPKKIYHNQKYPVMSTDYTNVAYPPINVGVCQSTKKDSSKTKAMSAHLKEEKESNQNKYDATNSEEVFNENQSISDKCKEEITYYPKEACFSESAFQLINPGVSCNFTIILDFIPKNIKQYTEETYYSIYHFLRRLYFSCLVCNSIRLKEEIFYLHLKGKKHKSKIESFEEIAYFVKICDICQQFLFGSIALVKEHFNSDCHLWNVKCKMDLIEQQHAVNSGNLKLGYSGKLTSKCIDIFSSKQSLNDWIEFCLEDADMVLSMASYVNRFIESDISKVLKEEYSNFKIEFVGSRAYGLAKHLSDADIYLEIDDVSIEDLEKHFSKAVDLFEVKKTIKVAKVPIIRLEHNSSNITCDINCSNPIGRYCSELIKTYISLDPRIRWIVMAVIEWGAINDIRGTKKFTSYGLTWLVLFFLMSPQINLIPPVKTLKSLYKGQKVIINGWDCCFTTDIEEIKKLHDPLSCSLSKYELLALFFSHYSVVNLKKLVLFPHDGKTYSRPFFANPHVNIHPLLHYNPENQDPLKVGGQIMIIDSLRLRENILKSVDENLADHFKLICAETLKCGWWN